MRKSTKFWLITLTILVGVLFYFFTEEMVEYVIAGYIVLNISFYTLFLFLDFDDKDMEFKWWKLFIVVFLLYYILGLIGVILQLIYDLVVKFNKWLDK